MGAPTEFLTRDVVIAVDDLATEVVEVPEWGGKVMVAELTGTDRDLYQLGLIQFSDDGKTTKLTLQDATARLVAMSVVDPETHERLFTDSDVEALGKKSSRALDRIYSVAQRLSALTDKDVEELVGNSEGPPSDDSSSG